MNETWFAPICAYCERGDASFWAEPFNAVSNGAFLVAAAALAWRERTSRVGDPAVLSLAILIAMVGIGSFLFHTLAVRWSLLADVIPIALFIYAYFLLAMRRLLGLGLGSAIAATLLFAALNLGLEPALDALTGRSVEAATNGSFAYLPAVLALAGVALGLVLKPEGGERERRAALALVLIAGLFVVSLTLRTLDVALCTVWPIGTHFLWHILNAAVLYGLGAALRFRQPA